MASSNEATTREATRDASSLRSRFDEDDSSEGEGAAAATAAALGPLTLSAESGSKEQQQLAVGMQTATVGTGATSTATANGATGERTQGGLLRAPPKMKRTTTAVTMLSTQALEYPVSDDNEEDGGEDENGEEEARAQAEVRAALEAADDEEDASRESPPMSMSRSLGRSHPPPLHHVRATSGSTLSGGNLASAGTATTTDEDVVRLLRSTSFDDPAHAPTRPAQQQQLPPTKPAAPAPTTASTTTTATTNAAPLSPPPSTPSLESFLIDGEIGRGKCGRVVVFQARTKETLTYVALKRVVKPSAVAGPATANAPFGAASSASSFASSSTSSASRERRALDELVSEVRVLHAIRHPNVVRFINWYETRRHVWVVTECLSGGSLENLLARSGALRIEAVRLLAADVGAALAHLHDVVRVAHGDVNPASVLLTENGVAKLGSFSRARFLTESPSNASWSQQQSVPQAWASTTPPSASSAGAAAPTSPNFSPARDRDREREREREREATSTSDWTTRFTRIDYAPPEAFRAWALNASSRDATSVATVEADAWGLGCLLAEALEGEPPFPRDASFADLAEAVCEDPPMLAMATAAAVAPPSAASNSRRGNPSPSAAASATATVTVTVSAPGPKHTRNSSLSSLAAVAVAAAASQQADAAQSARDYASFCGAVGALLRKDPVSRLTPRDLLLHDFLASIAGSVLSPSSNPSTAAAASSSLASLSLTSLSPSVTAHV